MEQRIVGSKSKYQKTYLRERVLRRVILGFKCAYYFLKWSMYDPEGLVAGFKFQWRTDDGSGWSSWGSIASYYLWHYGIEKIGASKTAQFTHLMPIFGIGLASVFLNESLETYHLLGAILIAFGIYLSLFYKRKI